eukprot:scaffold14742_cov58-Phaeocystis_antarctica.AAC.4
MELVCRVMPRAPHVRVGRVIHRCRYDDRLALQIGLLDHLLHLLEVLSVLGTVMLGGHLRHVVGEGGRLLLRLAVICPAALLLL